jgi:hypothetical protein
MTRTRIALWLRRAADRIDPNHGIGLRHFDGGVIVNVHGLPIAKITSGMIQVDRP